MLSPSKTQNKARKQQTKGRDILHKDLTKKLFDYLKSLSKKDLGKELAIQGNLLDRTYELYQNHSFDNQTIQALECYNGSVFKQLNLNNYTNEQLAYLKEKLIIISPMYGPLHSDTEIWPYRLEMSLKPDEINLYDYWQEVMTDYFAETDLIINLASNEYSRAVEKNYQGKIVDFYFKEEKADSTLKTMGYYVKKNRGKMLDQLIKNQVNSLSEIKKLVIDGYKFNQKHSAENEFYFIKPFTK
nr:YaaA family protein [Halanaerobium salsuginis]